MILSIPHHRFLFQSVPLFGILCLGFYLEVFVWFLLFGVFVCKLSTEVFARSLLLWAFSCVPSLGIFLWYFPLGVIHLETVGPWVGQANGGVMENMLACLMWINIRCWKEPLDLSRVARIYRAKVAACQRNPLCELVVAYLLFVYDMYDLSETKK